MELWDWTFARICGLYKVAFRWNRRGHLSAEAVMSEGRRTSGASTGLGVFACSEQTDDGEYVCFGELSRLCATTGAGVGWEKV